MNQPLTSYHSITPEPLMEGSGILCLAHPSLKSDRGRGDRIYAEMMQVGITIAERLESNKFKYHYLISCGKASIDEAIAAMEHLMNPLDCSYIAVPYISIERGMLGWRMFSTSKLDTEAIEDAYIVKDVPLTVHHRSYWLAAVSVADISTVIYLLRCHGVSKCHSSVNPGAVNLNSPSAIDKVQRLTKEIQEVQQGLIQEIVKAAEKMKPEKNNEERQEKRGDALYYAVLKLGDDKEQVISLTRGPRNTDPRPVLQLLSVGKHSEFMGELEETCPGIVLTDAEEKSLVENVRVGIDCGEDILDILKMAYINGWRIESDIDIRDLILHLVKDLTMMRKE